MMVHTGTHVRATSSRSRTSLGHRTRGGTRARATVGREEVRIVAIFLALGVALGILGAAVALRAVGDTLGGRVGLLVAGAGDLPAAGFAADVAVAACAVRLLGDGYECGDVQFMAQEACGVMAVLVLLEPCAAARASTEERAKMESFILMLVV